MEPYISFSARDVKAEFSQQERIEAMQALEEGKLLLFPQLEFMLFPHEQHLLNPTYLAPGTKNISYDLQSSHLQGAQGSRDDLAQLGELLHRYALESRRRMNAILPAYQDQLVLARTSFRPARVANRDTSVLKNDQLLHIDAFPATPNQGARILRFFSNINPHDEPRVWHMGESFAEVAQTFFPRIKKPIPTKHLFMYLLKLTRKKRSLYDHYMLNIHNLMKQDHGYQAAKVQARLELPAKASWIVATDQASHAALAGQFVLEQTFYLPVEAMQQPEKSPLKILEKLAGRSLV